MKFLRCADVRPVGLGLSLALAVVACAAFFGVQVSASHSRSAAIASLSEKDRTEIFEKIWKAVNDKYYDAKFNGVDWNAVHEKYAVLVQGLAKGAADAEFYALISHMLGELRDPHTIFRTPQAVQASKRQQTISVGLKLREVEGSPAVFSVDPDSDAARAGVEPGMIVRTVDGKAVGELLAAVKANLGNESPDGLARLRVYARLLAGASDTSVNLGLERADHSTFEVVLTRRTSSSVLPLNAQLLPSGYAYLKFDVFREGSAKEVKAALEKFQDAPGLILDLRNNGGGDVQEMRKIAGYFFNEKVFFGRGISRTGKPFSALGGLIKVPLEAYVGAPGQQVFARPVVILIADPTGSAAESFTEGMKETSRATVLGTQSCGCSNLVLDAIGIKGGGELHISEFGYSSPLGHRIEGIGVTPDIVIELKLSDLRQRRDAGIEAAEKYLKSAGKP